jgi:hypothetical protein
MTRTRLECSSLLYNSIARQACGPLPIPRNPRPNEPAVHPSQNQSVFLPMKHGRADLTGPRRPSPTNKRSGPQKRLARSWRTARRSPRRRGLRPWHVLKLLAREPGDLLPIRGARASPDRAELPPCVVAMEACSSAHPWAASLAGDSPALPADAAPHAAHGQKRRSRVDVDQCA